MFKLQKGFWAVASLAAIVLLFNVAAQAQDAWAENPRTRMTVFGSGSSFSSDRTFILDPLDPAPDQFNTKFVPGGKMGARFTYDLTPKMAFEGTFGYGTNNLLVTETTKTPPESRGFGVKHTQFSGNVLYFLQAPGSKIRTFVTGGIGTTKFSPTDQAISDANSSGTVDEFIDDAADITSESKFGFNFGGGVETKITSKLGIRFDFRDWVTGISTFGVPTTDPGTGADFYPVSGSIHNFSTSIGFVFFVD